MKNIKEAREQSFLRLAEKYKKKLDETPWWKIRKRAKLRSCLQSALHCAKKHGANGR